MKVQIIIGSTRAGRIGSKVGKWVYEELKDYEDVQFELVDLVDYPLPFYAEVMPPRALQGNYTNPIAKQWVSKVGEADGYIFVHPEYNHGYNAALKNALDYPYQEWNNKPVAFVGYGGPSGGMRATEQLREVAVELQMAPIQASVGIPLVSKVFDTEGKLLDDSYRARLEVMVEQLVWWVRALKQARVEIVPA